MTIRKDRKDILKALSELQKRKRRLHKNAKTNIR